ncbi:MAG TPA: hypothetical protein VGF73_12465 [Chthoniobacterales bacterium]|jgi:hypothetical protein
MKTISSWLHRGALLSSVAVGFGLVLCTSAIAGPVTYREATPYQDQIVRQKSAQKKVVFYVLTSASPIPKPISYIIGGILTTPTPIQIIGRGEFVSR